ncbi:MAG: hypothetical protein MJK08_14460 [Campylobacterales bacterium]|nr:hypothetical protein [Campylobacterales bacterium]
MKYFIHIIIIIFLSSCSNNIEKISIKNTNINSSILNNKLIEDMTYNFKLVYKNYDNETNVEVIEYIPKDEDIDKWSEMITISIIRENVDITSFEYIESMKIYWLDYCNDYSSIIVSPILEKDKKVISLIFTCRREMILDSYL